jgi:hypothetical protein
MGTYDDFFFEFDRAEDQAGKWMRGKSEGNGD